MSIKKLERKLEQFTPLSSKQKDALMIATGLGIPLAITTFGFWTGGAIALFSSLETTTVGTAVLNGIITGFAASIGTLLCAAGGAATLGAAGKLIKQGSKAATIGAVTGALTGPFIGYNFAMDRLEQSANIDKKQTTSIQIEFQKQADEPKSTLIAQTNQNTQNSFKAKTQKLAI